MQMPQGINLLNSSNRDKIAPTSFTDASYTYDRILWYGLDQNVLKFYKIQFNF